MKSFKLSIKNRTKGLVLPEWDLPTEYGKALKIVYADKYLE